MNCADCRELLVGYIEELLDANQNQAMKSHIDGCAACRSELEQAKALQKNLVAEGQQSGQNDLENAVMDRIVRQQAFELRKANQVKQHVSIWRLIMQSRITKLAAVAAVIVIVGLVNWITFRPGTKQQISSLEFLAKAQAAEQALFAKAGIVHLTSEITVYPTPHRGAELIEKLNDVKQSREEVNSINRELLSEWLVGWLPISSLQANGHPGINRIKLSDDSKQSYTIVDDAWYEQSTSRFTRVMETEGKIIFANSYDGSFVYLSKTGDDGAVKLTSEATTSDFRAPENPAEFLGLTAGVSHCLSERCLRQPIQEVTSDVLADGTRVTVYKVGFPSYTGEFNTYSLFKVRKSDEIIAELEYIANGQRQIVIRRVLSESVDSSGYSWNLAELSSKELAGEAPGAVTVASDVAIPNISVRDMVERAASETYIFATDPPWTQQRIIVDVLDTMSAPKRMFVILYKAQDNRHVILGQSETHNKYMASVNKQVEAAGNKIEKTAYANGYKVWGNAGPVAWWTEFTLRLAGFEPAANRSGYIVESPSGTILLIAVNGQLTKEELDGLINSLIPARDYQVK